MGIKWTSNITLFLTILFKYGTLLKDLIIKVNLNFFLSLAISFNTLTNYFNISLINTKLSRFYIFIIMFYQKFFIKYKYVEKDYSFRILKKQDYSVLL